MRARERISFLRRPPVVTLLSFLFLLCGVAFATRHPFLPGGRILDARLIWRGPDHALHFLYTPTAAWTYLRGLGSGGRALYAASEVTLDLVFPVVYTALFLALAGALGRWWEGEPVGSAGVRSRLVAAAALLAVIGGACDVLENLTIAVLSLAFSSAPSPVAWIAAVFTGLKSVALPVAALLLIVAVVRAHRLGWHLAGLIWLWAAAYAMGFGPMWAIVAFLLLALVAHWYWLFLAQYLFFLRFPLVAGLLLAFLPQLVGTKGATSLLGNLLVLSSTTALFWVSFLATLVALTVMSMTRLVYLTAAYRMELPLLRADRVTTTSYAENAPGDTSGEKREKYVQDNQRFLATWVPWATRGRAVVFGLLAIPLIFKIWQVSPNASVIPLALGWVVTVWLAWFMQTRGEAKLQEWVQEAWEKIRPRRLSRRPNPHALSRLLEGFSRRGHAPIVMMAIVAIVAYLALSPIVLDANLSREMANHISPIVYVFLVAGVLIWMSAIVSLIFDRSRVPVTLAITLWLVAGYAASKTNHFYRIVPDHGAMVSLPTPTQVVHARHDGLPEDYITVVAASGGGIKASLWTARVLEGLDEDVGQDLTRSIAVLSTNSGGSVGGMYYTDAFQPTGVSRARLDDVVNAAGSSSLSAVVWGMAYPDLLRVISGGLWACDLVDVVSPWQAPCDRWRTVDRGWAMDRRWEETRRDELGGTGGAAGAASPAQAGGGGAAGERSTPRRLGDWVAGVRAGWRPAHIFNATAVETGAAVRIATVALSDPDPATGLEPRFEPGSEPREFADLYPKADIDVVTAARLSASFPWVSPLARAWMSQDSALVVADANPDSAEEYEAGIDSTAYHLGDGGYFDNFGVFSALDFLQRLDSTVIPGTATDPIHRVILIEIRATPEGSTGPKSGGFLYSAVGPLLTMDAVRNSSQIGRNNREIELLREAWAEKGITLCPFVFELKVKGPLSWHLTQEERDTLVNAWGAKALQDRAAALRKYMDEPDSGPGACPPGGM